MMEASPLRPPAQVSHLNMCCGPLILLLLLPGRMLLLDLPAALKGAAPKPVTAIPQDSSAQPLLLAKPLEPLDDRHRLCCRPLHHLLLRILGAVLEAKAGDVAMLLASACPAHA